MESQFVGDFSGVHGVGKILFIGKNKEEGIAKFVFVEHTLKLLTGLGDTFTIVGINHEDNALGVLEVYRRKSGVNSQG